MKGSAGRSAAPGIKILEIQQKYTRNDIDEKYVKDRLEIHWKSVRKYKKEGQAWTSPSTAYQLHPNLNRNRHSGLFNGKFLHATLNNKT